MEQLPAQQVADAVAVVTTEMGVDVTVEKAVDVKTEVVVDADAIVQQTILLPSKI